MMKIVEVLGMPPNNILEQGTKTKRFFDRLPDNTWIPRKSKERRVKQQVLFYLDHFLYTCISIVSNSRYT
jgi:hypothetical protein